MIRRTKGVRRGLFLVKAGINGRKTWLRKGEFCDPRNDRLRGGEKVSLRGMMVFVESPGGKDAYFRSVEWKEDGIACCVFLKKGYGRVGLQEREMRLFFRA